jgi:hypothetical protein
MNGAIVVVLLGLCSQVLQGHIPDLSSSDGIASEIGRITGALIVGALIGGVVALVRNRIYR